MYLIRNRAFPHQQSLNNRMCSVQASNAAAHAVNNRAQYYADYVI